MPSIAPIKVLGKLTDSVWQAGGLLLLPEAETLQRTASALHVKDSRWRPHC